MAKPKRLLQLPDPVLKSIAEGEATLFLGAGASLHARDPCGNSLPDGGNLAQELREKVLKDDDVPEWPLAMLCEVAGEIKAQEIMRYVRERFEDAVPTDSHKSMPWYRWRAIATTNYDCLVEHSYRRRNTLQNGSRVVSEQDLAVLSSGDLPIIKLHGCSTDISSLVLSMSDLYRRKREAALLFQMVEQLHVAGTVIYIGYSLADQHIIEWIFELTRRLGRLRQPVVFVAKPGLDRWQQTWVERGLKAEYVPLGFDGFMTELQEIVPPPIAPSMVVGEPFTPCSIRETAGHGTADIEIKQRRGKWECFFEYAITDVEGWACAMLERFDGPVDVGKKKDLIFDLFLDGEEEREAYHLEALKLESRNRLHPHLLNIANIKRRTWVPVRVNLDEYRGKVDLDHLERITLADNGHRVLLGKKYRVGLRNVRFE